MTVYIVTLPGKYKEKKKLRKLKTRLVALLLVKYIIINTVIKFERSLPITKYLVIFYLYPPNGDHDVPNFSSSLLQLSW